MPKILVVEDSAEILEDIMEILNLHNYVTYGAANAFEAIELAEKELPDVILSDIAMAGMDGIEMLRKIRSDKRTESIPLIFLTARSDRESFREGMSAGASDYIIKPFKARQLIDSIEAQLKQKIRK